MPHTRKKSFHPKPLSFSNKLFFNVGRTLIIIQRESEKTFWKEDSEKVFYNLSDFLKKKNNASDFDLKVSQRGRFWIEKT